VKLFLFSEKYCREIDHEKRIFARHIWYCEKDHANHHESLNFIAPYRRIAKLAGDDDEKIGKKKRHKNKPWKVEKKHKKLIQPITYCR
jgi:hypothetical protein